jgi:acyl dehydratase
VPTPTVHVGLTYERHLGWIDEDAAVAFARATNDPNPLCLDARAVPALFTGALGTMAISDSLKSSIDPGAIAGVRNVVHGSHVINYLAPVLVGQPVEWAVTNHAARQTSSGVVVTQQLLISTRDGVPLVEHLWSSFHIGGRIEVDLGPVVEDDMPVERGRAAHVGTYTVHVDRDQAFRYSGLSADHVPHAVDDTAARSEGFDGKILQGMCTLSMTAAGLVSVVAGGDPARLRQLAARFSSPTYPGEKLTIEVHDAGRAANGDAMYVYEATSRGAAVITRGRVQVRA